MKDKKNIYKYIFPIIMFILTMLFLLEIKTVYAIYNEKTSNSLINGVVGNFND